MTRPADAPRFFWLDLLRRVGTALLRLPRATSGALVIGWAVLVWTLSSRQIVTGVDDDELWWPLVCNLAHAPLFGFLALFLAAFVFRDAGGAWPRVSLGRALVVALPVAAWGAIDEWHQSRVPGRNPSVRDLVIDFIGGYGTLAVARYVARGDAAEAGVRLRLLGAAVACVAAAMVAAI